MKKDSEEVTLIITGRYDQGTTEENELVSAILGGENTQERFNIYFNWYNTIHEVGHLVSSLIGNNFSFLEEERFANAFAVAFWKSYGNEEIFNELRSLVPFAVGKFNRPVAEDEDISDFAQLMESGKIEANFNNYGWFQFSLVSQVLAENKDLENLLIDCGLTLTKIPEPKTLEFSSISEHDIPKILKAVFTILADWGISIPRNIYHALSNNPNHHMVLNFTSDEQKAIREALGLDADVTVAKMLEKVVKTQLDKVFNMNHIW